MYSQPSHTVSYLVLVNGKVKKHKTDCVFMDAMVDVKVKDISRKIIGSASENQFYSSLKDEKDSQGKLIHREIIVRETSHHIFINKV